MWESDPSRQCVCLIYEAHVMSTKGYVFPLKEWANYLKEQSTPSMQSQVQSHAGKQSAWASLSMHANQSRMRVGCHHVPQWFLRNDLQSYSANAEIMFVSVLRVHSSNLVDRSRNRITRDMSMLFILALVQGCTGDLHGQHSAGGGFQGKP